LSPEQREELLGILKARFEQNMNRHIGLEWNRVKARLEENPEKLPVLGFTEEISTKSHNKFFSKILARLARQFIISCSNALTLATTHQRVTDLGYLFRKNPRVRSHLISSLEKPTS
jgi:Protein of unknown function (DUF4256)